ncbi:MAG: sigma-54 dependent transcriptional regulator [Acidobacteriota bacterium]
MSHDNVRSRLRKALGLGELVGQSRSFLDEVEKLPAVAACDAGVLIRGETGTGKELFARAVHLLSPRASGPFVPINCGAIPMELVENELFGHARAAFTGADRATHGLISEAEGGTLFLDEIDSLPLAAQVKLLRFLEQKEYRRLGSARLRRADLRVVAASNCDLQDRLAKGTFRSDLYYRLNVVQLDLPPLRDRCGDILLLAEHFLERYRSSSGAAIHEFAPEAAQKLLTYRWPGNVRELENVVQRAVILNAGSAASIRSRDLVLEAAAASQVSFQAAKSRVVAEFERQYLESMLSSCGGNVSHAARTARKDRRSFFELIRKHNIDPNRFRRSVS